MRMASAVKERSSFAASFLEVVEKSRAAEPEWATRLRQDSFELFEALGFPSTDQEDWKYTNVAPIARGNFRVASDDESVSFGPGAAERFVYDETKRSRLVFVNGFFVRELSSTEALPSGLFAGSITEALGGEYVEVVRERLLRDAVREENSFAALNAALRRDGAFLYVPKGIAVEIPIQLLFLSTAKEGGLASFPRVLLVAERGSEVTLIESYAAAGDAPYLSNSVTETFVGENARVKHYKVQQESESAFHVASTRAEVERAGSYDLTTITLGARLSRHDASVRLLEEGAECWVDGLYVVGDGQHTDTHSLIDHRRPRCTSHQNYKGILDGKSRAVFNGRIFVHEGASGTDAQQSNKNLLLSPDARVDTKPQLEIFNDDVKCAHGTTVGQLEEEELFYLVSRGLHPDLARNLLTYGFAEEIVEKIKVGSIKAQLDEAILNRLHAQLEV